MVACKCSVNVLLILRSLWSCFVRICYLRMWQLIGGCQVIVAVVVATNLEYSGISLNMEKKTHGILCAVGKKLWQNKYYCLSFNYICVKLLFLLQMKSHAWSECGVTYWLLGDYYHLFLMWIHGKVTVVSKVNKSVSNSENSQSFFCYLVAIHSDDKTQLMWIICHHRLFFIV